MRLISAFGLAATVLAGTSALAADKPALGTFGVDLSAMDRSVRPGDNFFLHVNGNWIKGAVIPPDRSSTGSFQDLQISSEMRLRTLVEELAKKPNPSVEERKIRDLYDGFVDTNVIEVAGLKTIQKNLDYFAGLKSPDDVARAMASVKLGTMSIYNIGIGVDDKNPDNYSLNLSQAGLGLPDRDYYLSDDKALAETRTAYAAYLTDMMTMAGMSDAAARAARIVAVETEIAKVSWTRADRRDADKIYNPMQISELKALAPEFP